MAKIAYIDDNKECLEVVKLGFEDENMEIDIYDDPIDFYNQNKQYKVIISDFSMPNLNGQEFLKLVKEKFPKSKTIIYSGYVEEIDKYNIDIDQFLDKPVQFDTLFKAVKYLMFEYDKEEEQVAS